MKALWLSTIPASVFQAMANLRKPMFQIRRLLELNVVFPRKSGSPVALVLLGKWEVKAEFSEAENTE